jgi:hypothetical protein
VICLKGKNKAEVLARLYNASKPLGLGMLHYDPADMTEEEATELLGQQSRIDYHKGRVMKVNLSKDEFDPSLYDRDNGQGAAAAALAGIEERK